MSALWRDFLLTSGLEQGSFLSGSIYQVNPIWYFVFYTMLTSGGMEITSARSHVYFFRDQEVCNTFRQYEIKNMASKLPKGSAFPGGVSENQTLLMAG